ncbi:class I adenylate-forming enzyme family protein [Tropicibacter oceani]|uniref:Class I adenylate-forming enzyme family protein n=1 Tax=Tropicibacter oceani TaxID=3058420 RepID=A0ABY8QG88_9RHOB|nr:class I adenylate-forming enzyme family protein [Tropicibacter oceani]WGW03641.1 class I adenylate-forming enzyme family protein [Tropicibacter oceani]
MTTAWQIIYDALTRHGQAPVIERRGQWRSGAAILQAIAARAEELAQLGLRPGQTALIVVSDNLVAIETLFACWHMGASAGFVDFRAPAARITQMAARMQAALVVGRRRVAGLDIAVQAAEAAMTDAPPLTLAKPEPEQTAIVFTSSGTTGEPRLRPSSQGKLGKSLDDFCRSEDHGKGGCLLGATSFAYSASCNGWLRALASGKRIVALDLIYRLEELDAALMRPDVTECALPPVLIRRLAALGDLEGGHRYPQLTRLGSVGGPAAPRDKIAALTRLSPQYRMTYSCVGVGLVSRIGGEALLARPASCGKPVADVRVRVLDGLSPCAVNQIGTLEITNAFGATVRPGDLGWLDEDGYLYIAGRIEGLFCRNGVNFPAERLTQAALELPQVIAAAAIAQRDGDGGDVVHLFVQCPPSETDSVTRHLRQGLAAAEFPDHLHLRDNLPVTVSGKVDLGALSAYLGTSRGQGD